jgi:hypothetical protein
VAAGTGWRRYGILDVMAHGSGYGYPHPTNEYPSAPYPSAAYPTAAYPPGAYPAAQYPPGAYPPGAGGYPPGAAPPPPPPRRRAPLGVHIVAVLQYLTGLVLLLAAVAIGLVTFHQGRIGDTELPESVRSAVTGAGVAIAAFCAVLGLLALLIGRRIHRGRQWARVLLIVLSGVSLGANVYSLFTTGLADPLSGLVLPSLYLVLLNTRPARDWFRYRPY